MEKNFTELTQSERMEILFKENFADQARAFIEEYSKIMAYYRCAMMEIETKLNVLNEEFLLKYDRTPIVDVRTRLKSPQSINDKLRRYGCAFTMRNVEERINDVAGVRVICSFPEDVYTIARALMGQDVVETVIQKDYIRNPKPNGYRSLHLILRVPIFLADEKRMMKVEVQLRTIAMDFWATLEHQIRYKKDVNITPETAEELRLCAELSSELDARMDAIRRIAESEGATTSLDTTVE